MFDKHFFNSIYPKFEKAIIIILAVAIMVAIAYATLMFVIILFARIIEFDLFTLFQSVGQAESINDSIALLQNGLFQVFGGFLLIILGIELIGTIKSISEDHHIKIEHIVSISIIASARHLITIDYHHSDPLTIFAAGFVVLVLIVGYFLLKIKPSYFKGTDKAPVN